MFTHGDLSFMGILFSPNHMKFFAVTLGVELGTENLEKPNIFLSSRMHFAWLKGKNLHKTQMISFKTIFEKGGDVRFEIPGSLSSADLVEIFLVKTVLCLSPWPLFNR